MAINTFPISRRTLPGDPRIDANGSYTLPQYAFIPHPALQQLATGNVPGPLPNGFPTANFAAPPGIQRRYYPTAQVPIYGVRVVNYKSSP